MQIVCLGYNLYELLKSIFWEKNKKNIHLSSAEFAKRVVMVNP